MTRRALRNAVDKARRMPAVGLVRCAARLVPFRPLDVARLRFLVFDGLPRVPAAMLRGRVEARLARPGDLGGLAALQDKASTFAERFANGDYCIVGTANDRIVGYEWFCDRPLHLEEEWGLPIAVPRGTVYAYDAYVDPAYRNGGVWLRFKAVLGEWMAANGKQQIVTFVEDGNVASWRTHLRFGFFPVEDVLAMKLFGRRIFRRTSLAEQPAASFRSLPSPAPRA